MLPHRCKNVSFWRFRGDFICRLCHAGSTRAEGGPRRAFPPLIFVGRAASRPVGAACPAAGLPPVRRLYCFGAGGVGRPARLILLWRASAAFCGLDGHKARLRPQSLASASPQRIIRCRSPDVAGPWVWVCGVRASAAFCSFGGHKARSQSQSLASASPQRIIRRHAALSDRPLGCGGDGCGCLLRFAGLTGTKPASARKALHPPRHSESSAAVRPTPPAPWVWE